MDWYVEEECPESRDGRERIAKEIGDLIEVIGERMLGKRRRLTSDGELTQQGLTRASPWRGHRKSAARPHRKGLPGASKPTRRTSRTQESGLRRKTCLPVGQKNTKITDEDAMADAQGNRESERIEPAPKATTGPTGRVGSTMAAQTARKIAPT